MAAALRRALTRRLPGPVGHRDEGRAGPRAGARERAEQQLSERPTQNLAAYDAYLKGEEVCWRSARPNDPPSLRRPRFLQTGRRAGPQLRPGLGRRSRWPLPALRQTRYPRPRAVAARAGQRPKGHRTRTQPSREASPRARQLPPARGSGLPAALEQPIQRLSKLAHEHRTLWRAADLEAIARPLDDASWFTRARPSGWIRDRRPPRARALPSNCVAPEARRSVDRADRCSRCPRTLGSLIEVRHDVPRCRATCPAARPRVRRRTSTRRSSSPTSPTTRISLGARQPSSCELLLRLTPAAFDDDGAAWAIAWPRGAALPATANVRASTRSRP